MSENHCPFVKEELARQEKLFKGVASCPLGYGEMGLEDRPGLAALFGGTPVNRLRPLLKVTAPLQSTWGRRYESKGSQTNETSPPGQSSLTGQPSYFPGSEFAVPNGFAVSIAASSPSRMFVSTPDLTLRLKLAGIPYEPLINMAVWKPVMVFESGNIPMFQAQFPFEEFCAEFLWACEMLGVEAFQEQGMTIRKWS